MDSEGLAAVFPSWLGKVVEMVTIYTEGCHDADLGRMQSMVCRALERDFASPPFAPDVPGRTAWTEGKMRQVVPEVVAATHDADRAVMLSRLEELTRQGPGAAALLRAGQFRLTKTAP